MTSVTNDVIFSEELEDSYKILNLLSELTLLCCSRTLPI